MFKKTFKDAFLKQVQDRKDYILQKDLDKGKEGEYYLGYDSDEVHNGVGYQTVRYEILQDEERAEEDAKNQIIEELEGEELEVIYEMFASDNQLRNATIELLRGL